MNSEGYAKIPIPATTRYTATPLCRVARGARVRTINGDITTLTNTLIVHQTNCVTRTAAGLAQSIFKKFPVANSYNTKRTAGSVSFHPSDGAVIVNLYGQYTPGPPRTLPERRAREQLFWNGLQILRDVCIEFGVYSVSFPERIGCGLAGGDWVEYLKMIYEFAACLPEETVVQIVSNSTQE